MVTVTVESEHTLRMVILHLQGYRCVWGCLASACAAWTMTGYAQEELALPVESVQTQVCVVDVVIVEDTEVPYEWGAQTDGAGIVSIKLNTDYIGSVNRLLSGKRGPSPGTPTGSSLETTIEWDTTAGEYQFSRVELGLVGRRVWLVHELPESDEDTGAVGIRLRKEW